MPGEPDDAERVDAVRDLHDSVARSADLGEASVRPPGTSAAALDDMVADVLAKLAVPRGARVLDLGCGIGLLAVPLAAAVGPTGEVVAVDLAPSALAVLAERAATAGVGDRCTPVQSDATAWTAHDVAALGAFDRILVYAAFHYAPSDTAAAALLANLVSLLRPDGRLLLGNLPVAQARPAGAFSWLRGAPVPPTSPVWRLRAVAHVLRGRLGHALRRGAAPYASAELPPETTVSLTVAGIEGWLAAIPEVASAQWVAPAVGVPLSTTRADLVITRAR